MKQSAIYSVRDQR